VPGQRTRRRLPWMVDFYLTVMRIAVAEQFQYRAANWAYTIGMVAEPVIYLVVWSTVAEAQGGQVGGFTPAGSPPTTSSGRWSGP
jgi:ABC-type uncharacterized transport system permease subunit